MSKKFVHVEQREWSPPREPIPTNPMKFVFPRGDGKPDCIPLIISQIGNSPACALSIRGRVRKERLPPETKWLQRRRKNITLLGRRDSAKTNAIGFLRKKESLLQIKLQSQSPRHFKRSLGRWRTPIAKSTRYQETRTTKTSTNVCQSPVGSPTRASADRRDGTQNLQPKLVQTLELKHY